MHQSSCSLKALTPCEAHGSFAGRFERLLGVYFGRMGCDSCLAGHLRYICMCQEGNLSCPCSALHQFRACAALTHLNVLAQSLMLSTLRRNLAPLAWSNPQVQACQTCQRANPLPLPLRPPTPLRFTGRAKSNTIACTTAVLEGIPQPDCTACRR